jgi:hypothetical protein
MERRQFLAGLFALPLIKHLPIIRGIEERIEKRHEQKNHPVTKDGTKVVPGMQIFQVETKNGGKSWHVCPRIVHSIQHGGVVLKDELHIIHFSGNLLFASVENARQEVVRRLRAPRKPQSCRWRLPLTKVNTPK